MPLPDDIDGRLPAGLVLAQVGYHGAMRPARTGPGALVVVVGDGLVGQYAAQVSRARGADVLLVGRRTDRLAAAARHSATEVLDARTQDLAAAVRARRPEGADVVIDTSSTAAGIRAAAALLRRDGELVLLGWYPEGENLLDAFWFIAGNRELAVHFTGGWTRPRLDATLAAVRAGELRVAEPSRTSSPGGRPPTRSRFRAIGARHTWGSSLTGGEAILSGRRPERQRRPEHQSDLSGGARSGGCDARRDHGRGGHDRRVCVPAPRGDHSSCSWIGWHPPRMTGSGASG